MIFSGFCFEGEAELFAPLAPIGQRYSLSGFSYGAILAFREALKRVRSTQRLQSLHLFSPAFFQDRPPSFIQAQLRAFQTHPDRYIRSFLARCGNPSERFFKQGSLEELEDLLTFKWELGDLEVLVSSGVAIYVYLGGRDRIIDPQRVREFFTPFALIHLYPQFNHLLSPCHP